LLEAEIMYTTSRHQVIDVHFTFLSSLAPNVVHEL